MEAVITLLVAGAVLLLLETILPGMIAGIAGLICLVAGVILGIDPFDQPDVEASKVKTRELTAAYESSGKLPAETPILRDQGVQLFTDKTNAEVLAASGGSLATCLKKHLDRLGEGDYFALLAYVERNALHTKALQEVRRLVRDRKRVATCLGFGPRFLHSTGQAYKGGPDSGVFLQITADDAQDLPVPGQKASFGIVKAAQARGDFDVLTERGRRALRSVDAPAVGGAGDGDVARAGCDHGEHHLHRVVSHEHVVLLQRELLPEPGRRQRYAACFARRR
jgi:hypothetical protein